eukprot:GDKI01028164.1.p1 GENE.GDKI01028164.1~~GDKI01028164.1.p1  ORF type:complete len:285 (+),score=82.90 GDKI01028164.1:86-940(+)
MPETRVIIVTGASRGFGQQIPLSFLQNLAADEKQMHTRILLLSRSEEGMAETKDKILAVKSDVQVEIAKIDLSQLDSLPAAFTHAMQCVFKGLQGGAVKEIFLFHNAGTLGPLQYAHALPPTQIQTTINENITSFFILTGEFLRFVKSIFEQETQGGGEIQCRVCIVNVSSLAAIQPFAAWSLYCSGKAARDMCMKTVAAESAHIFGGMEGIKLKTLNYAPGPLQTDMFSEIVHTCAHTDTKTTFKGMLEGGNVLTCEASANKLMGILKTDTFTSGAHIDYYDV